MSYRLPRYLFLERCSGVLLVDQDEPVSWLALVEIHHRLVRVLHRVPVGPRMYALLYRELEHMSDFRRRADQRTANLDLLDYECEGIKWWNGVFWCAELNELPTSTK